MLVGNSSCYDTGNDIPLHRLMIGAEYGKTDFCEIPGIGPTFVKDFARISVQCQRDLVDQIPERLYEDLCDANRRLDHKTSKNYLYVLRMAVYYCNGGRDPAKLKWNAWKD